MSDAAFNLLQLCFARILLTVNGSIDIPLLPLIFALSALLLTRILSDTKQLKDDSDLIV